MSELPQIDYPDLPVAQRRDEIMEAMRGHQVVIVVGETGSGKTTQLPKMAYELACEEGKKGRIGCTQPRRLAAATVARRVAEEMGTELGERVGYQVRFVEKVKETTNIKFMTDGILLREIQVHTAHITLAPIIRWSFLPQPYSARTSTEHVCVCAPHRTTFCCSSIRL